MRVRLNALSLVGLPRLMARGAGSPAVGVALIDGPVALGHPLLASATLRLLGPPESQSCAGGGDAACDHGTFVAGVLAGRRAAGVPGLCEGCTILVRPVFASVAPTPGGAPGVEPPALAAAIDEVVDAGAQVINLSLALTPQAVGPRLRELATALDRAAAHGVIVVAAAGNDATVGGSALTRHPATIPVAACDPTGAPLGYSNLGISIGRRGLAAPGEGVTSLGAGGGVRTLGGTSVAVPFVAGAAALLSSEFPGATGDQIRAALTRHEPPDRARRPSVVPPLLNAWASYQRLAALVPASECPNGPTGPP